MLGTVTQPDTIRRILLCLGRRAEPLSRAPARDPTGEQLDFDAAERAADCVRAGLRIAGTSSVRDRARLGRTMSAAAVPVTGEAAILHRVIRPERADLSTEAARSLLKLDFDDQDRQRMHHLAVKAQDATLTGAEEAELESYRRVGRLLDLMHSKARRSLKNGASGA